MNTPPRLARALLWLIGPRGDRDEVTADLAELFSRRAETHGRHYARRRYWRDVASFISPGGGSRMPSRPRSIARQRGATMSALAFESRQVIRSIVRRPAFFLVAALTLGVGFAAHLSAFSLVDRLLLAAPAHVRDADRLFRVHIDRADGDNRFLWFQTPYRTYQDLRAGVPAFAGMGAYRSTTASVGTGADARELALVFADERYFGVLGVRAQIGRTFTADENRPPSGRPVVVLGDAYWRGAFAADPNVVGRTLRVGTITYTVIGVMPAGFTGDTPERVDAWAPLMAGEYELPVNWMNSPVLRGFTVLARLAPGVAPATASEQAALVYRRSVADTPAADPTAQIVLATMRLGRTPRGDLTQSGRIAVWIEAVALLVLIVALANVVNLQMSRAAQQRRDTAVRVALGAGRGRVLGAVTLEMLVVSGAAAAVGMALTFACSAALQRFLMPTAPAAVDTARLAVVAIGTILVTSAAIVFFAAFHVRVEGISERLKTGRGGDGFSRDRLRQALLVAQVVVSTLLLVGAGLFLESVRRLDRLQFGHDHDHVLVVTLPLRLAGYDAGAIERFYERALREVRDIPGVGRVAAAQTTPFAPSQAANVSIPGLEQLPLGSQAPTFYTVTPDFFQTMGMRILRGRGFVGDDRAGAPLVMVVEDALATALWPGQEPLGKCLVVGPPNGPCRQVVGIASNTRRFVAESRGSLRFYLPLGQRYAPATPQPLFVRATGDPLALAASVRSALIAIDPGIPYARMRTLREMAEPEKRPWRLGRTLFAVFGLAALIVSTAGVYALLSFMVAQRSREIGVRLALGASPARTLGLVVRQSVGWALAGLAAGLAVSAVTGKFIRPLLFETSPYDVRVFITTAAMIVMVAMLASVGPAIRASRVDPNVALRAE